MSRSRLTPSLWLACALTTACTDAPTAAGRAVPLDLRPSYQVTPSLFPSPPIDRVRLLARNAQTRTVVGSTDEAVDPNASQWSLGLAITLGGAPSLEVTVEVELLAGQGTEWSGRLGPLTVRGSEPPRAQNVPVYRGPLGNMDVVSLALPGAPTQIGVGGSAQLTPVVQLAPGSTATPRIFWASTDPTVASVTTEGAVATLTGLAAGTTRIVVTAGPASAEFTVEVRSVAPPGFDIEWRGITPDWNTATNWSLGRVPIETDQVFIPASPVDPTMTGSSAQIADLRVATGATLTLTNSALSVDGDLVSSGTIAGNGRVIMIGSGTDVRGTIRAVLEIADADVTASGALSVDALEVTSAGRFIVNGQVVDVAGLLTTRTGGRLRMAAANDRLTTRDASFAGGDTQGELTAGELRVRGNFTASGNRSFAATDNHRVVFEGPNDRTVTLLAPGQTEQRFRNVTFDQTGTVTFQSPLFATGTIDVLAGPVVADDHVVAVGVALNDANGQLTYSELRLVGAVTMVPAAITSSLVVDAVLSWPRDATVAGDVTINASLDLGTRTLRPSGSVFANGTLVVPAGGALYLSGALNLAAGSTLQVDGVITAGQGCVDGGATIRGAGSHPCGQQTFSKTWVGGDPAGPSDWHRAANWSPPGIPGPADDVFLPTNVVVVLSGDGAARSLVAAAFTTLDLGGFRLSVAGDLNAEQADVTNGFVRVTGPGSVLLGTFPTLEIRSDRALGGFTIATNGLDISGAELDVNGQAVLVSGTLSVSGAGGRLVMTQPSSLVHVVGSALFDGDAHEGFLTEGLLLVEEDFTVTTSSPTGFAATDNHTLYLGNDSQQFVSFALPGATQQRVAHLVAANTARTEFRTDAVVTGAATVSGFWAIPAAQTVTVGGDLVLYSGATLEVEGTVTVGGVCANYGGTIRGSGSHPCPPPPTADRTWIGGDPVGANDWFNASNWQPAQVPTASETVLIGANAYPPALSVGSVAEVAGLTVGPGGALDLGGSSIFVGGDLAVDGQVFGGWVELNGPGTVLYGLVPDLLVSVPRALSGALFTNNLVLNHELSIGPHSLAVNGNLDVRRNVGALVMRDPGSQVHAFGNVSFNGASHVGKLTAGILQAYGDFTVAAEFSTQSFHSTGTAVWLAGEIDQSVWLSNPGLQDQVFVDLGISKISGEVIFDSDVYVSGALYSFDERLRSGTRAQPVLEVRGILNVYQTVFDGVPLRLVSSLSPNSHTLSQSTFTNMPTTSTQLHLELIGQGPSVPFVIQQPTFTTTPTTGYYLRVVNTSQAGALLRVQVTGPTPSSPGTHISTSGAPVQVEWPYTP